MPNPRKPFRPPRPDRDNWLAAMREKFLRAVDAQCPAVSDDLAETVGPAFGRVDDDIEEHDAPSYERRIQGVRAKAESGVEPHLGLMRALDKWATSYNLQRSENDWVLEYALHLLWLVRRGVDEARLGKFGEPSTSDPLERGTMSPAIASQEVELRPPGYRPEAQTLAEAVAAYEEWCRKIEEAYRSADWEERPHKPHMELHFRWLARFQVLEESTELIAAKEHVSPRSVERNLKCAAEVIGLTRRTM